MWLSQLLVAAAIAAQAGTDAAAATTVIRHRTFAIPYQLHEAKDEAAQPVEVQLFVSTDRGANWRFYAKGPVSQKHFMFRAGGDGEYWFAIRMIDRSGRVRPASISGPGLKVVVDASGKTQPKTEAQRRTTKKAEQTPKGSVAVAVNPPIGNRHDADADADANAERPRMVNSRLFELEYEIDQIGPSGIGRVELWGTRDGGRTWRSFALDDDNRSPMLVSVPGEGIYGFCVTVSNGAGLGGKPPAPGDRPELLIGVDLTKPVARIVSAKQGVDGETGHLIISWQADDRMLADRPVSLFYSEGVAGPWRPLAEGLENSGRHAWRIDEQTPASFYLRMEVRDVAGNVCTHEMSEPVEIDRSLPKVRIRGVRPLGGH
ncbi:MAG: hypothetical protein JW959_11130 [Pirellulales bacterium]|nr:hypothetical protein [Pirellulales bacterium]